MIYNQKPAIHTKKRPDVLIVGGGIMGLWAARRAIQQGYKILLIEKNHPGAGASGGFLGALMPHLPERWDAKIEFQYEALCSIESAVTHLEADTGHDCGFRRCGRLMPVVHEKTLTLVEHRIKGARKHWGGTLSIEHFHPPFTGTPAENWLNEAVAPYGATFDNFSARIDPRAYVGALAAFARSYGTILEGMAVREIIPCENTVVLENSDRISAGRIIVANGWCAYELLQPFMQNLAEANGCIGRGIKGQAVLTEFRHDDNRPILYDDGSYIIPHPNNRVAIGSTSVKNWQESEYPAENAFNPDDMAFYNHALELAPWLRHAPIVERWAAVRPRNTLAGRGTEPFLAPVPEQPNLHALIGGFKISLGIAHLAYDRVL
jgi:glycine oxidase